SGIRHELHPAGGSKNACPSGLSEQKGTVPPSKGRPTSDLIKHKIPNYCTSREGRIVEYLPSHSISEKYEKRYYNEYNDRRGNAHHLSGHQRKSSEECCNKCEANRCFGIC